ncbi:MAG: hypothetical protein EHM41_13515 [Chloroflexi bacterium]|nr:MAG: hypothetical protein EHM41_13515 [Chloroflexota bacterium]
MLRIIIIIILVMLSSVGTASAQEATPTASRVPAAIESPLPGQAVQGSVAVTGSTAVDGFVAAEISFGYLDDPTGTWFFINQINEPVTSGQLAVWDTTTLTDGDYALRLVVLKQDGSQEVVVVPSVRVRNYTPIETDTPTLPAPTETPAPGETPAPTETLVPSPTPHPVTLTPLPQNPAEVTPDDITTNVLYGILIAVGIFAILGLSYTLVRILSRK